MFHLFPLLPALYAILRFVAPLPWPVAARVGLAAAMLAASQMLLWNRLSSGSVFAPEYPRALVILLNWGFGTVMLLAVAMIAVDAGALLVALARRSPVTIPPGVRYAVGAIVAAMAAIGVAQAIRVPPLKDVEVRVAGLPPAFEGYRLVQLTDLHLSRLFQRPWAEAVVARTNALGADLVVVTGDFIDGPLEARAADLAPLAALSARDGVWFVPGNHEYFFGYDRYMRHIEGLGLRPLANAHAVLTRGDNRLVLAGVTDLSAPATGHAGPDLARALAGTPAGAPVILLDHQPRRAAAASARGVALQLSGHTHGGMVRGMDRLVARANAGFVSGAYPVGGMTLYVSNGTALWPGFALRLGVPSELTRITLRRAAGT